MTKIDRDKDRHAEQERDKRTETDTDRNVDGQKNRAYGPHLTNPWEATEGLRVPRCFCGE